MLEQLDTEQSIYHVRLWIGEGRDDVALARLEEIQSDDPEERREIAYLSAWCHIRLEHWTEALRLLIPLYPPRRIEDNWNDAKHNERERRAFTLFCLGNTAFNLSHYEEASQHYTECLKVLSERRVHLPKVQIKAQSALGRTSIVNGLYAVANQHYEKALRLCKNPPDHEDLPDIYYGLCEAHRLLGNFELAYNYGKMALALYEKRNVTLSDSEGPDRTKEGYIQNLLGRICLQMGEYSEANDHYMKALSIATTNDDQAMKMVNFTALADLYLAQKSLDEAKHYCQRAQEAAEGLSDDQLCGTLYLVYGKVAQAQGEQADGKQRQRFLEEARALFEKAQAHLSQAPASSDLPELYGRLAQIHEQLGQHREAVQYWKTAYESLSGLKGPNLN